jgi:excisionase family DNA binding protein
MGLVEPEHDGGMRDLSPREAAEQTGLSRSLIYREIERGHLRAYKVGGRLRISVDALIDWKRLHAVVRGSTLATYEPLMPSSPRSDDFRDELRAMRRESAA